MSTTPSPFRTSIIATVFAAGVSWLASMNAVAASAAPGASTTSTALVTADSTPGVRELVVSYSDLDLSTVHGLQVLDARLRSAVRNVCGDAHIRDLRATRAVAQCRSVALQEAQDDLRQAGEGMNAYWLKWRAAYVWSVDEAITYN